MKEKTTVFAGFINGYKAGNIASSASSINYHLGEMRNSIMDILSSQRLKNAPVQLLEALDRLRHTLSITQEELITSMLSCGETIKMILSISKQTGDPSALFSDVKMKRLIYHYLEVAELIKDKTISELAISIAELF